MFYSFSVALPKFSFQYFGAHGPHGLRVLTPGALVPAQTAYPNHGVRPAFPLSAAPKKETVQVPDDCCFS